MALNKVGALWLKEKNGKKFMSGTVETDIPAGANLLVFKNTYKEAGDSKPDYTINLADDDDRPARQPPRQQSPPPPPEDIPFSWVVALTALALGGSQWMA